MDNRSLLKIGVKAALLAGEEILRIYLTDFHVETKSDNTPVTNADKASGAIIARVLAETQIPLISEEDTIAAYHDRQHWQRVWLIDPLDGTKEYVKRNGEFAVNIALVENNYPTIGIIYSPILKQIYFGAKGLGSYRITWSDSILNLRQTTWPIRCLNTPTVCRCTQRRPFTQWLQAARTSAAKSTTT